MAAVPSSRPLLKSSDHGPAIVVHAGDVGAKGDRWVRPFLEANRIGFQRLEFRCEVRSDPELGVALTPGPRIGAIPLLGPSNRRVAAGLLIEPRFRWASLGAVFDAIGFVVSPGLGGAPLVPGSAREVPPWVLAGPVIDRVEALLRHRRRGFVERGERRASPRGRVEWGVWASTHLPRGEWTTFPCRFSEPDDDPRLIAAVRWTLSRLAEELSTVAWSAPARHLLHRAAELQGIVGPGAVQMPASWWVFPGASDLVAQAVEAMTWVVEERGLGGARSLDGLAWDLSIDAVWEAWVAALASDLALRLGMVASPFQGARRILRWEGAVKSMGSLVPDVELRGTERVVWLDAKYKRHLELLARSGWQRLSADFQADHRADIHQALAYASLADAPQVDTVLVYPGEHRGAGPPATVATVTSGRRRVRLILASVPFGFRTPEHKERCLRSFRDVLAA